MVVAYYPDVAALSLLCVALLREASEVVVVDNTADPRAPGIALPKGCDLIRLDQNYGTAGAFNAGIRHGLEHGADVIVLFDQDSEVPNGFLERLVEPLRAGEPGVSAPVARDKATGREYPSRRIGVLGEPRNVRVGDLAAADPIPAEIVISSGCAATADTYREVGLLDDELFIDFVDVEWCLRCRAKGVPIVVVPRAVMSHSVGSGVRRAFLGLYRGIVHNPTRNYYKIRNAFLLARRPHAPFLFSLHQLASVLIHHALQLALMPDRIRYLRSYATGVAHGLRGVTGKWAGS